MKKDIDKEIEKLLAIKEIINEINNLRKTVDKLEIVSQLMYDYKESKGIIKPDVLYYITTREVGQYLEDFQG